MVKSNQPLQIRLTEPVIFLKGPSTGLDFRGRPQIIAPDAQPAMLRGLLTLRLTKPTRIRKIEIKLEGKARTEWPEGIGPRRMDTSEEHVIISEKITFFNAIKSESGPDIPRATSLGPGISTAQIDVDDDLFESEQGIPNEGEQMNFEDCRWERGRRGQAAPTRSASAMPGPLEGDWDRPGPSRWQRENRDGSLGFEDLSVRDRGPSPAYTPLPSQQRRRSSMLTTLPTSILSPIMSAPHSANTSDRGDSTSTERQRAAAVSHHRPSLADEPVPEDSQISSPGDMTDAEGREVQPSFPTRPSILGHPGHRLGSGNEVRFAPPSTMGDVDPVQDQPQDEVLGEVRRRRAASVRTMNSVSSASTNGEDDSHVARDVERHPVLSNIHTADPSPMQSTVPSPAPSIHADPSTDYLPRNSISSNSTGAEGHRRSGVASGDGSRRSSILGRDYLNTLDSSAPSSSSSAAGHEVRQGHRSRIGSASTIVIDNSGGYPPTAQRPSESRQNSGRSVSGTSLHQERSSSSHHGARSGSTHEGHQSKTLRHSLASALGAVKERMSSRSRSRVGSRAPSRAHSRGASRAPSIDESTGIRPNDSYTSMSRGGSGSGFARINGSARSSMGADPDERTNRFQGRLNLDDLVPPSVFARDTSTGRSRSTDRTASPARHRPGERSPSRNRGRNKGMKVLTGALDGKHHDEDGEHLHNWKEFKKGTYNYPISFPIPVDSPPTIHAEFGAVVYRLKATVVRVGALTTNLVEELEVSMIATPQEDDLEETENVTVERQWEEQMRYQIVLHGKAFPIGGQIPISVRLMPLMKCKVHRLTVALEEKTDYFAQGRKVARHETPKKFTMLFVKQPERLERQYPLLPIMPDDPTAAKDSPVAQLAAQAAMNNPALDSFDPTDEGEVYASLYDPMGPWHLEKNLQIPDCAANIKFTTKHEQTNISVGHWMKVTIRVERGDDAAVDAKGKRKQFDIIIETPIKILDCRVDRQINSLPTYTPQHPSSFPAAGVCSVHGNQTKNFAPIASTKTFDPLVVSAPDTEHRGESSRGRSAIREMHGHGRHEEDTLLERNIVYDRLMSGQETETGELPPTYGEAVANGSGSVDRGEAVAVAVSEEGAGRARSRVDEGRVGRGRDGGRERESRSRSRLRVG